MNGKKKLKAETPKISLVRPVRGCCLSTGYTLVPPTGKKGNMFFSNFIAFTVGVGNFLIRGCWLIFRCLPLFTACVQQTLGTASPDFQHFWFDPYHVFQPKGRDEFYHRQVECFCYNHPSRKSLGPRPAMNDLKRREAVSKERDVRVETKGMK